MTLHIAFSVTDSYVDYLGTTIYSIVKSNPNKDLRCYILSTGLSNYSREKLSLLEGAGLQIEYVLIDAHRFDGLPLRDNISIETYFRLILPSLLPHLERVLYLDCDILVQGDLTPLFETDLTGYYAAGVNERDMLYRNTTYRRSLGFTDEDIYINAGVCLFHLQQLREDGLEVTFFEQAELLKERITHQDILNIALKDRIKPLSVIYNYTSYEREVAELALEEAVIIHYNWHKPWVHSLPVLQYNYAAFARYQETHRAYLDLVEPLVSVLVLAAQVSPEKLAVCLNSLAQQIYPHTEVIVLAAEGETLTWMKDRVRKDSCCRVVEGDFQPSMFRTYYQGLSFASGAYICFVDGAEWVDEAYISGLMTHVRQAGADLAVSSFSLFNEETSVYSFFETDIKAGKCRSGIQVLERFYGLKWFEQFRQLSLTGKLYRRELIERANQVFLPHSTPVAALLLFLVAKRVAFGPEKQYVRRLSRIDNPFLEQVSRFEQIKELEKLLLYAAFRGCELTHLKAYYDKQLQETYTHLVGDQNEQAQVCLDKLMAHRSLGMLD